MKTSLRLTPVLRLVTRASAGVAGLVVVSGCFLPEYQIDNTGGSSATTIGAGGTGGTVVSGGGGSESGSGGATTTHPSGGSGGTATTHPSGGSGGTTTTNPTGGSGGTTTTLASEECNDGIDNDGDGQVDCADPDCEQVLAAACKPKPPAGWSYVRAEQAPYPDNLPPSCGGAQLKTYFGPPSSSICQVCSCQWQNAKCSSPQITCYYGDAVCGGTPSVPFTPPTSDCLGPLVIAKAPAGTSSCVESSPAVPTSAGTCNPGSGQTTEKWTGTQHTCPATTILATGCGQGLCVAAGSIDFTGPLCVVAAGDLACPAGWSGKQLVHTDGTDNRTCTGCNCGLPQTTCTPQAKSIVFNDDTCSGNMNAPFDASCDSVGSLLNGAARSIKPPQVSAKSTSSTCSGGVPGGQVDTSGPHTICCQSGL